MTVSMIAADGLGAKPASPLYRATTCVPAPRTGVVNVAVPVRPSAEGTSGTVNPTPSMKNVTAPVGPSPGVGATTAVKVTGWPIAEGFGCATRVVAVAAGSTTRVTGAASLGGRCRRRCSGR